MLPNENDRQCVWYILADAERTTFILFVVCVTIPQMALVPLIFLLFIRVSDRWTNRGSDEWKLKNQWPMWIDSADCRMSVLFDMIWNEYNRNSFAYDVMGEPQSQLTVVDKIGPSEPAHAIVFISRRNTFFWTCSIAFAQTHRSLLSIAVNKRFRSGKFVFM